SARFSSFVEFVLPMPGVYASHPVVSNGARSALLHPYSGRINSRCEFTGELQRHDQSPLWLDLHPFGMTTDYAIMRRMEMPTAELAPVAHSRSSQKSPAIGHLSATLNPKNEGISQMLLRSR